jgi:hypothetical protein
MKKICEAVSKALSGVTEVLGTFIQEMAALEESAGPSLRRSSGRGQRIVMKKTMTLRKIRTMKKKMNLTMEMMKMNLTIRVSITRALEWTPRMNLTTETPPGDAPPTDEPAHGDDPCDAPSTDENEDFIALSRRLKGIQSGAFKDFVPF